jgi:BirA family biotin operon repressor/biotin-[acetyl-CoA-carboxylase] ligase
MDVPVTPWRAESLWLALRERLPGLSVEVVGVVSSTSSTLIERARGGRGGERSGDRGGERAPGRRAIDLLPCLLVAEHQTGGRGRMGRQWHSQRGASLTFSLSLPLARADWSGLSLAIGVALADALEPDPPAAPRIRLKWPNDLWIADAAGEGRKLGGILVETLSVGDQRLAVIGVGLNVRPIEAPEASSGIATLSELDPQASPPAALHRVAGPLVDALLRFDAEGFAPFVSAWDRRDLLRGRAVRTTDPALPGGVAEGVADDGALRLRTADGSLVPLRSGEVSVRPADGEPA